MNPEPGTVDIDRARRTLSTGAAVVLPNPAPLTYTVTATDPRAVNTAKGRPADQAVALWAHHPQTLTALADALALDDEHVTLARRLLTEERVTLLVPLRVGGHRPDWLSPASQDGWALLFGTRWAPLVPLLDGFPVLYVSSANRTGCSPAATTRDAVAMFPAGTAVLGTASLTDDEHRTAEHSADERSSPERTAAEQPRSATTTLRLYPDGQLGLHRHGAQDQAYPSTERYLDHVLAAHRGAAR
ncbi:hypothetical protein [Kitasatospora sp. McL0602]|uniref:hypothetical protein n=1 Tax=Kitasatospora sp. McL0602 TaxID=3439530 RepID=UPI003F89D364